MLQIEKKADEKVLELKKEIEEELMRVLQTQDRTMGGSQIHRPSTAVIIRVYSRS